MSEFKMFVGPMASGKSRALLQEIEAYEARGCNVVGVKPLVERRDAGIVSRSGLRREAISLQRLGEMALDPVRSAIEQADVVAVDEIFMFNEDIDDTYKTAESLLRARKTLVVASLDLSGMGKQMSVVSALLGLGPTTVTCTEAICDTPHESDTPATHTRIYDTNTKASIRDGLPELVPQDPANPTYGYSPVCRDCFFEWPEQQAVPASYQQTA